MQQSSYISISPRNFSNCPVYLDEISRSSLSPRISSLAPRQISSSSSPPSPVLSPSSSSTLALPPPPSAPPCPPREWQEAALLAGVTLASSVRPRIIARANGSFFPASLLPLPLPSLSHFAPLEVRLGKKTSLPTQEFKRAPQKRRRRGERRGLATISFSLPFASLGSDLPTFAYDHGIRKQTLRFARMPAPRFPLIGPRDALVAPLACLRNEVT